MTTDLGTPRVLPSDEGERAVLLAAPRGYCAGVDRAVVTVEKALDLYGAAGLRAQADRAQQARRRGPRVARRDLRRGARRGAGRGHRGLLRARRVARGARRGRGARAQDRSTRPARWSPRCTTRRSGSPATTTTSCSSATRATRRSRAPRARRPSTSSSSTGPTTSANVVVRDPAEGGLALPDHAVGRRDDGDRRGAPGSGSRCCSTRPATTSATPPRTASSRSRRSPATPTW